MEERAQLAAQAAPVQVRRPAGGDSYSVIYAGRLFGYYRYPEVQSTDAPNACRDGITPPDVTEGERPGATPEAAKFRQGLQLALSGSVGTVLRLATGDDFAPFILSRQMWDPADKHLVEKSSYSEVQGKWLSNEQMAKTNPDAYKTLLASEHQSIPLDNVGCFMRLMPIDAIVPGEFDFYFGPARLQQLADYLMRPIGNLPITRMLGVNLYMQTNVIASAVSQTASPGAQPSQGPPTVTGSAVRVTTPKTALPWMRSVQIGGWNPSYVACILDVHALLASLHVSKAADLTPAQIGSACQAGAAPAIPLSVSAPAGLQPSTATISGTTVLTEDTDYAVAVMLPATAHTPWQLEAWQPFTVAPPFFGYTPASKIVSPAYRPWIIRNTDANGQPGQRVAVFGVVDPNLMQGVGRYNAVWLEQATGDVNDHYETDVQVSDPAEALKQAIEYCEEVRDCTPATRIVILAQMPQQIAYAMVGSFRGPGLIGKKIDLVIAEADPVRGTGNRITVRLQDGDRKQFEDPVVVVPDPAADVPSAHRDRMLVKLDRAIVTPGDYTAADDPRVVRNQSVTIPNAVVATNWFPSPANAMIAPGNPPLLAHLQAQMWGSAPAVTPNMILTGAGPATADDWAKGLRQLGLKAMARYCSSDAAMLQLRDVFWVPQFASVPLTPGGYEALMDAIFWKGDFIHCMTVPGSAISSVLQRSQDLQQKQVYGLLSDASLDRDWSLDTLGMNPAQTSPASPYRLIAGKMIDSKKLYSIGTTDFLSNGDTGYPSLQGAEPPPDTPWSRTKLVMLSDNITATAGPLPAIVVLDSLTRLPVLPASELFHPDHMFLDYVKGFVEGAAVHPDPVGSLERQIQDRPIWSFELYKSDFSYSVAAHSGLERAVPQQFPGVSAVDLTAANSSSFSFDYMFRIQRDHKANEFYAQFNGNYGYKKTRQASKSPLPANCAASLSIAAGCGDPYVRNQTADYIYNEAGYAHRFHAAKNPYGWKLQLPIAVQTQVTPLLALPEGFSGPSGTPAAVLSTPSSIYVEGRPGFRWDFSFPKPANWSAGQGGGGGGQSASGSQQGSSGGGGKKGKGGSSSSASSGQTSGGGGGSQTQTFDSFLEVGYEFGPSLHGPKDFVFNDPALGATGTGWLTYPKNPQNLVPANACAAQTLGNTTVVPVASVVNCFFAASNPVAAPYTQAPSLSSITGGRRHFQDGMYANYHFDVPVPVLVGKGFTTFSNMEVVLDLRSDYFFGTRSDTPIDTHFLVDAKQALNIPILMLFGGKVSLSPSVESIFYTNKISNHLYKSYSGSVSLSYTFEKRTGLNALKALGYQNPVPTLPTLPSR